MKTIQNNRGQSLIEYLILTALLAIGVTAVVRVMGHSVSARFADITNVIQGRDVNQVQVEAIETRHYKKKDMSDFMQGTISRGQRSDNE